MKRLDVYLVENFDFTSRNKAQELITNSKVSVNNKIITKPSFKVNEADIILISEHDDYASRGAYKLLDAIESFNIDLNDKIVMDIGASTGGFSDVCLKNNASYIYALDVGHDQLIDRIKYNSKVKSIEGINCRYLTADLFDKKIDFICMDVSFISIKKIIDNLVEILDKPYEMVFLIKPQFEVGKQYLNSHGIVKNIKVHKNLLIDYLDYFNHFNFSVKGLKKCSTIGKDGNQEYLIYLTSESNKSIIINIDDIVKE